MTNYELHEFDPTKVFTGEINTLEVNSFKYESYDSNTLGQLVIDKNTPTEGKRKFVSLATKKTSQSKFNQVVDIDFAEFTVKNTGAALDFLQAKINSLESDKAALKSGRDTDKQKIDQLNNQIASLQDQITAMISAASQSQSQENAIPNHLNINDMLKVGPEMNGIPTDRIMSNNRKYIAVIQSDRNLVVYSGDFNEKGQPKENTAMDAIWSDTNSWSPDYGDYILKFYANGLASYKYDSNGNLQDWFWYSRHEDANAQGTLSYNAQLILEDTGRLVMTSWSSKVWASK